jgi:hypothetical protein
MQSTRASGRSETASEAARAARAASETEFMYQWMTGNTFTDISVKWNSPEDIFCPYEVTSDAQVGTLIQHLKGTWGCDEAGVGFAPVQVLVRGRDKPGLPWDRGIARIGKCCDMMAIIYESGDTEFLSLKKIAFDQRSGDHLVEVEGKSVVDSLYLYGDLNGDGDLGFYAEEPERFKMYLDHLPEFLKYYGLGNTIAELNLLCGSLSEF